MNDQPTLTTPPRVSPSDFWAVLLGPRCPRSDLPESTCAHCRSDVLDALARDPEFAAWLDTEAPRLAWEVG